MFQIGGKLKSSHESLFFCVLVCPLIFCTIICGFKDFRLVDKLKKHNYGICINIPSESHFDSYSGFSLP